MTFRQTKHCDCGSRSHSKIKIFQKEITLLSLSFVILSTISFSVFSIMYVVYEREKLTQQYYFVKMKNGWQAM